MEVNWDTTQRDSNIYLEVTHKDQSTRYVFQHEISVRTFTARHAMYLITSMKKNWGYPHLFTHNTTFSLGPGHKIISYYINFKEM